MEINTFFEITLMIAQFITGVSIYDEQYKYLVIIATGVGALIILALLAFQGFALFKMAKRREFKHKWLAFVPFANIMYMGKLAGTCSFFGQKMKRAGLYAMLAQIVAFLVIALRIAAELYLYFAHGVPRMSEMETPIPGLQYSLPDWEGLIGFGAFAEAYFLDYSSFAIMLSQFVYHVLMLVLVMGLCKKYSPSNYILLSMLTLLIPISRFFVIFALRNRAPVDYAAYIRAKQEEMMRRQQQYYNQYGNPYGRPYQNGNPYANPYGRQYNPYGNPYPNERQGQGAQQNTQQTQNDEPFAEFSSGDRNGEGQNKTGNGASNGSSNGASHSDSDGFFD